MFPALAANALNVNDILQKLQGAAHVVKGATLTAGGFVAAAVLMVAQLPPRANVPELVIKPTSQAYQ